MRGYVPVRDAVQIVVMGVMVGRVPHWRDWIHDPDDDVAAELGALLPAGAGIERNAWPG